MIEKLENALVSAFPPVTIDRAMIDEPTANWDVYEDYADLAAFEGKRRPCSKRGCRRRHTTRARYRRCWRPWRCGKGCQSALIVVGGSDVDFDWAWPKCIDRDAIEVAIHLDFLSATRNVVLVAAQGALRGAY